MTDTNMNPNEEQNVIPEGTEMHVPADLGTVKHSHLGPILGVLVIALVLILGGLFLWGGYLAEETQTPLPPVSENNEPETPRADADVEMLGTLSPSDELDAIDADLGSTNLGSLDADMAAADAELDAALAP